MSAAGSEARVVVVGGGFTGLAAAYELVRRGLKVTVLEQQNEVGGLAACLRIGNTRLERFYHHWFTNDQHVMQLINDLGAQDRLLIKSTRTGMYYANKLHRLSTPWDVLRFHPLPMWDRLRLGLLLFRAGRYKDWRELDNVRAAAWLTKLAGPNVFRVMWEPLLLGKFGEYAYEVSAAWFWAKLMLRGRSRGKPGQEKLAYFRGGFAALADLMVDHIAEWNGEIRLGTPATGLQIEGGRICAVRAAGATFPCDAVILTPALPIIADLLEGHVPTEYTVQLRKIQYLASLCLILRLDRSLSGLYWMNVNDPSFPFVGVIEHTNFEAPSSYADSHIVYLSKYLPAGNPLYNMSCEALVDYAIPHIQRMFPQFNRAWTKEAFLSRARYAQPIVTCGYGKLIPDHETPISRLYIATMAQVYPEDRGTNYAIREGRKVAQVVEDFLVGD